MTDISFSRLWYWLLLGIVLSYLLGCVNLSVVISRARNRDIRNEGSGNPGTMNMARTFGLGTGLLVMFFDAAKGAVPILCGYFIFRNYCMAGTAVAVSDIARYLFGVFAILGHIFPVTMKFRGGKGIATTFGLFWSSLACEHWWFALVGLGVLVVMFMFLYVTEWGSMTSLIVVAGYSICQGVYFFLRYEACITSGWVVLCFMLLLAINVLTWTAHRRNLYVMMAGEEHRTSIKKMLHRGEKKKGAAEDA